MNIHRFFFVATLCCIVSPLVGGNEELYTPETLNTPPPPSTQQFTRSEERPTEEITQTWTARMLRAYKTFCEKPSTNESLRIMPSPLKDFLCCNVSLYLEASKARKELLKTPEQKDKEAQ